MIDREDRLPDANADDAISCTEDRFVQETKGKARESGLSHAVAKFPFTGKVGDEVLEYLEELSSEEAATGQERDALADYFREMDKAQLISAGDELTLARTMLEARWQLSGLESHLPLAAFLLLEHCRHAVRDAHKLAELIDAVALPAGHPPTRSDASPYDPHWYDAFTGLDAAARTQARRQAIEHLERCCCDLTVRAARPGPDFEAARLAAKWAFIAIQPTCEGLRLLTLKVRRWHEAPGHDSLRTLRQYPRTALESNLDDSDLKRVLTEIGHVEREWCNAKNALVIANLRLAIYFARQYQARAPSIPLADLIQEGNLGLIKAVEKFDYRLGFRFSTYAAYWIRLTISRAIARHQRSIRLPFRIVDRLAAVERTRRQLIQELGRPPRLRELARATNEEIDNLQEMIALSQTVISMDLGIDDDEAMNLHDRISQAIFKQPADAVSDEHLNKLIHDAIDSLTQNEATVLCYRFGLMGYAEHTLQEIGDNLHLSRERVRQIEAGALKKLKTRYAVTLGDFLLASKEPG